MNHNWKKFIEPLHPCIDSNGTIAFGQPKDEIAKAQDHIALVDLSYMGLIKISGENSQSFLQGQLSCDLNKVNAKQSQLGGYCNHKGRMISAFRLLYMKDEYYLYLPRCTIPATLSQLQKVAIFSKVVCSDVSDNLVCLGIAGVDVIPQIKPFVSIPDVPDSLSYLNKMLSARLSGSLPRYLIIGEPQTMISFWDSIYNRCICAGSTLWRFFNICAGIPTIYQQSQELFLPNRLNFHLLNGLSFDKGCYVGQEVIARLHYKGTLKHHMYRIWLDTTDKIEPATPILDKNDNQLGHIVDQVIDLEQGSQALAVMPIKSIDSSSVFLNEKQYNFKILELPYSLEG